ncbi:MAG: cardiolipin synthase, partial [Paracoccaceae bacterium]
PVVGGNDMVLLVDGPATFDAIFAAVDAAQDYVLVQFYIVRDDPTGRALLDRLVAAARRGVTVRFVCDPMGSVKLSTQYLDDLRAAGVQVIDPSEMRGPKTRFQLNFRNHRKTVIVDGVVGFTGGLNVGEEYMGRDPAFGHWRDTHVRLQGPIVSQLQLIFAEDWHWATEKALNGELNWDSGRTEADMPALIVATGPGDSMETGALFFFSAIANATKRIWIASPYFVPDRDVLTALKHAALEGLDVRILLPEVADHRVPWLAAFAFFDEIREAGVQVWRYNDGFMHQKAIVVDDAFAAVGTTNLDNRSFRLNFEAMAAFFDPRAASAVEQMLAADFTRAYQLEKPLAAQPRMVRFGAPVSRLFAPIL